MDKLKLKSKMCEHSMTQENVAKEIGMSLSRFNAKLNGKSGAEFSLGEVRAIKGIFNLDAGTIDEIFFQ